MWAVFLLFGLILLKIIIPNQIQVTDNNINHGPDLIPKILAYLIIIISLFSVIYSFIRDVKHDEETKKEPILKSVILFGIVIGYTYLIEFVSFITASIISMFIIMWFLRVREWYKYLIIIFVIIILKVIFENLLYINLP